MKVSLLTEQSPPAGSGPAGPDEENESESGTTRRSRNFRGAQVGAALTSRSAGWIVAAALAGSLGTYLFAPPRTSTVASAGVAYRSARPAVVGPGRLRVVHPGGGQAGAPASAGAPAQAGVPAPVQVPAQAGVPASGQKRFFAAPPRQIVIGRGRGRVRLVLPPGNVGGPVAGQVGVGPGSNWVGAPMPGCAAAGPGRRASVGWVGVPGRRGSVGWVGVPAPQRVVIVRPRIARRFQVAPRPGALHLRIVRLPGARRVVIVGPGWRSPRIPRQVHLGMRGGKRLVVIPGGMANARPGPGPACIFVGPAG